MKRAFVETSCAPRMAQEKPLSPDRMRQPMNRAYALVAALVLVLNWAWARSRARRRRAGRTAFAEPPVEATASAGCRPGSLTRRGKIHGPNACPEGKVALRASLRSSL